MSDFQREVKETILLREDDGKVTYRLKFEERTHVEDGEFEVELRGHRYKFESKVSREKDALGLLSRPIWIMSKHKPYCMWTFEFPSSAASFMFGRYISRYRLYVAKRIYDWPESANLDVMSKHIENLIHMHAAFFEDPVCEEWVKEDRKRKKNWKANRIPEELD